jgi:hypothetical protein
MNARSRLTAAGLALVAMVAFGCAKGGTGVHPDDPGVPTSHVILTVTVRDAKGDLITPAESPQWPNVVISVLGEDAHGEPPLNFPELLRKPMDENPWVREGRSPGSHATDLNPGPGPRALDVVVYWTVAIEGPA